MGLTLPSGRHRVGGCNCNYHYVAVCHYTTVPYTHTRLHTHIFTHTHTLTYTHTHTHIHTHTFTHSHTHTFTLRDSSGHTPYFLSKDKPVRDSFRRFMGDFPSAYDYPAAQVPSPLTEAMERGRKEKMAERKKAVKKAKKQREKAR